MKTRVNPIARIPLAMCTAQLARTLSLAPGKHLLTNENASEPLSTDSLGCVHCAASDRHGAQSQLRHHFLFYDRPIGGAAGAGSHLALTNVVLPDKLLSMSGRKLTDLQASRDLAMPCLEHEFGVECCYFFLQKVKK